jgi:hypothetical protein
VLRQQELNRAMVLAKSTTNLMQRLSSLPTAPDVSPLRRRKAIPSSLSHKHHLHIRWCCIDPLSRQAIPGIWFDIFGDMYPVYVRGTAFLAMRGSDVALKFQKKSRP